SETGMGMGTNPPGRQDHRMVYDATRGELVMFGGTTTAAELHDTWTFDGTAWTEKHPAHVPPARHAPAMVYDPSRARTVLFGGMAGGTVGATYYADTWTWDGSDWTSVSPSASPPPRAGSAATWEPKAARVFLFAGQNASSDLVDAWTWDGS